MRFPARKWRRAPLSLFALETFSKRFEWRWKILNVLLAIQSLLKYTYTCLYFYLSNELIAKQLILFFSIIFREEKLSRLSVTKICTLEVFCLFPDRVYFRLIIFSRVINLLLLALVFSVLPRRSINHHPLYWNKLYLSNERGLVVTALTICSLILCPF